MIKLCGFHLSQLPDRRGMTRLLHEPLYLAWRERHKSVRDERAARASLAGILLLQLQGLEGKLLYDRYGRPYFEDLEVDFNLSHTDQSVFCAIETRAAENTVLPPPVWESPFPYKKMSASKQKTLFNGAPRVGVDAEDAQRLASVRICPMADRWFSDREHEFFMADPTDAAFLRVWTRKEALVKWTGEGLRSLRSADTVLAPSVYSIRFYEYRVGTTLVTLCCHQHATPPPSVHMYSNSELLAYGILPE